jgi:hypothetical protein
MTDFKCRIPMIAGVHAKRRGILETQSVLSVRVGSLRAAISICAFNNSLTIYARPRSFAAAHFRGSGADTNLGMAGIPG